MIIEINENLCRFARIPMWDLTCNDLGLSDPGRYLRKYT